ncbi:MAG: agmatine deiminase [Myxococcales bacterium]|jgi:agmatine deiminase|nr:agmatine deiminase [Myxococcales bacterium]
MTAQTPSARGYRMPAEWEPHLATWLAWPHERRDWPGKLAPIPWVYGEVVRHLAPGERVRILVKDAAMERRAGALLARVGVDLGQIDFFRIPTDRSWTRDFCPLFVKGPGGQVGQTNWRFNGWAKYANHKKDDAVGARLAQRLSQPHWTPEVPDEKGRAQRVVLEGGSIDVDGRGTLLTTEECLLSPVQARNPGLSREQLEEILGAYLGVRKVLWLGEGIAGDDTHGHVDDLARFVDERTVVLAEETDPGDANFAPLRENRRRLEAMANADGQSLRVVPLPMPAPVRLDGVRLPASYANFYIGNAAVLVPTFNDPQDRRALEILAQLFPSRKVVGIHAVDLVWGLGTLHCMTQQQPLEP